MLGEWQTVNRDDPVLARALSRPGQATSFHAPTLMSSLHDGGIRRYLQRRSHHQNGVAVLARTGRDDCWDALGFYRAQSDQQFTRSDLRLVQILAPHILQAIKINLRVAGAVEPESSMIVAIARDNGHLRYAGPGLAELLRLEWPAWNGCVLPGALMDALRASPERRFTGQRIAVDAEDAGGLLMLRLKTRSALASLSTREAEAATLYGAGLSTKEIARRMEIAPSTARNFVQRVYAKLNVSDKAALAVMLSTRA